MGDDNNDTRLKWVEKEHTYDLTDSVLSPLAFLMILARPFPNPLRSSQDLLVCKALSGSSRHSNAHELSSACPFRWIMLPEYSERREYIYIYIYVRRKRGQSAAPKPNDVDKQSVQIKSEASAGLSRLATTTR